MKVSTSVSSENDTLMQMLQMASQAWDNFEWTARLEQLDAAATAAREQKEQSLAARKQLGETTKVFKKSVKTMDQACVGLKQNSGESDISSAVKAMDVLSKECRQTIKAYQEEIDNLTRRCKSSENAFASIHAALGDIADPTALLKRASVQIHDQQNQISQLLNTVEEVNKEMSNMEANAAARKNDSPPSVLSREEKEELLQLRREVRCEKLLTMIFCSETLTIAFSLYTGLYFVVLGSGV